VLALAPKQTPAQYAATLLAAGNYGERLEPELLVCTVAGSAMPMHYAANSAIHQLRRWVEGGPAPDNGPRFAFAGGMLAKDADGNTEGGIRLPPIDVPVARYESTACQLGGLTVPFTDADLIARYGDHAGYYELMAARTDAAVAGGWMLPEDAIDLMARACAARVRFLEGGGTCATYVPPAYDTPLASPDRLPPRGPSGAGGGGGLPATGAPAPVLAAAAALALGLLLRRSTAGRGA
jgi:hypothetical protein